MTKSMPPPTDKNPFWVWTPEDISADQAILLFVDIFTDFPLVESPSHSFIHGPRGSGKSMMFRMMRADCARRRQKCTLRNLSYLGIYIPIKRTEISQTELVYLDKHPARYVFNEHLLCLYFANRLFMELSSERFEYGNAKIDAISFKAWAEKHFFRAFAKPCPGNIISKSKGLSSDTTIKQFFAAFCSTIQDSWETVEALIRALPLNSDGLSKYAGPLLSYHGFLLPLFDGLRTFSFLPRQPVYLLVDDADNLNRSQTEILNSWIATRTTSTVCIKASTQLRYKTRLTFGGQRIEAPHDYHDVDVSVLYTTQRDHYLNRLSLIVGKRLQIVAGLPPDPKLFFPEDVSQEAEIRLIAGKLLKEAEEGRGRGNRPRDDANRYARPEFIRLLGGERKSTHSYSYSGFEQLAHISSGVIRWFLEPAAQMYSAQKSITKDGEIKCVVPRIQDEKIRDFSEKFFFEEFAELKKEAKETKAREGDNPQTTERETDYDRLECLINAMGKTFFNILTDKERSERRVFSIALSDRPDDEVQRVLELGVQEGYFYRTSIGTKTGHGRTSRYVLSRRLAPYFSLDPTSFSGYLFVTGDNLRKAMLSRNALLREKAVPDDDIQMELPIP
jgi:hypothetical protein